MPNPGQVLPQVLPKVFPSTSPGFPPRFSPDFPHDFPQDFPQGFPPPWIWWIWHPQNGIWSPFGHIQRSPSQNCRSGTVSPRRNQPWWSQSLGTPLFLGQQGYVGPCSQKILALFSRAGVRRGLGLAKNETRSRCLERFPTLLGLACPMP